MECKALLLPRSIRITQLKRWICVYVKILWGLLLPWTFTSNDVILTWQGDIFYTSILQSSVPNQLFSITA